MLPLLHFAMTGNIHLGFMQRVRRLSVVSIINITKQQSQQLMNFYIIKKVQVQEQVLSISNASGCPGHLPFY